MHVAHVYKDVYPPVAGGIEKHIDGIRRAMPDVRSDVVVCARGRATSTAAVGTGHEVRVGELGRVLSTPIAPAFPLHLRRVQADVFHVHMPNPLGELAAVTVLGGRPYVASYHADIVRQARLMPAYRPLLRRFLARARAIVVGSESIRRASPVLAPVRDRLELVPYAVDTERYDRRSVPTADIEAVRSRHGTPLVVSVGRLVHYKGIARLIEAAAHIPGQVVVGGAGPLEAELLAQARARENVTLLGYVPEDDLPTLLAAADCFVLPSANRAESYGIATLEAQAMGVPAVVTDVGTGTHEAIEPGVSGVVVPGDDVDALARAVRGLLDDPDAAKAMGERGARRVRERHGLDAQAACLRAVYQRAILSRPGGERRGPESGI